MNYLNENKNEKLVEGLPRNLFISIPSGKFFCNFTLNIVYKNPKFFSQFFAMCMLYWKMGLHYMERMSLPRMEKMLLNFLAFLLESHQSENCVSANLYPRLHGVNLIMLPYINTPVFRYEISGMLKKSSIHFGLKKI